MPTDDDSSRIALPDDFDPPTSLPLSRESFDRLLKRFGVLEVYVHGQILRFVGPSRPIDKRSGFRFQEAHVEQTMKTLAQHASDEAHKAPTQSDKL